MIKLTYARKNDFNVRVTVLGDAKGIYDLYWQLTHNYKAIDGTEICGLTISNLNGDYINPNYDFFENDTPLSHNINIGG